MYLKNNGSVQLVAEKQYIHRNTVNNQLKKIEKITNYNPLDLHEKVKFILSFYIRDIMWDYDDKCAVAQIILVTWSLQSIMWQYIMKIS